jgi:hypothetical protein
MANSVISKFYRDDCIEHAAGRELPRMLKSSRVIAAIAQILDSAKQPHM